MLVAVLIAVVLNATNPPTLLLGNLRHVRGLGADHLGGAAPAAPAARSGVMDRALRTEYLRTLGIDVWVPRREIAASNRAWTD